MPIKGKVLYPFRWFWRQDISTQVTVLTLINSAPAPVPLPVPLNAPAKTK